MDQAWEFIENVTEHVKTDYAWEFIKKTGYMFYVMNPKEHLYETIEQVPDYYKEVAPSFVFVIVLEIVLRFLKKRPPLRLNDTITNICQGMLVEIFKIPLEGAELILYVWIYNNFRIVDLPWDSVWTWLIGMVGADFFFYWMHRATHQINFLWFFHEPHHSSEDYNMTTPLRISIFTSSNFWYTHFPLAIAIPPQVFLVHYQLVIIYQFWLHSELFPPLKGLDLVLNTPGLHRVHHELNIHIKHPLWTTQVLLSNFILEFFHKFLKKWRKRLNGRNRRFIDKNFGSFFSIWDRMFGTFEPETEENITYGVTTPLRSFNSFWIQTNYFWPMCKKFLKTKGIKNKLWSLIKGPGWSPGKSWLGNLEDIPEPSPDEKKYDPEISVWMKVYCTVHCSAVVVGYAQMIYSFQHLPTLVIFYGSLYITITTIAFGAIFDDRPWISSLEIFRCVLYFMIESMIINQLEYLPQFTELSFKAYRLLFLASLVFWVLLLLGVFHKIWNIRKLHSS